MEVILSSSTRTWKNSEFGSTRIWESDPNDELPKNLSKSFVEITLMIISGVGDGVMQAANEEVFENKRFDAIAKYFDYFSTGRLNFCLFGQPKPKMASN